MGGMDDIRNKANELSAKAKGARRQGGRPADEGAERAGQDASERTDGRLDEQAPRGRETVQRHLPGDDSDDAADQGDWT